MSFDALKITCSGCDFEAMESFQPLRVIYTSDAGNEVSGRWVQGWCYQCDGYTKIEHINPQALAAEIGGLEGELLRYRSELDALRTRYFLSRSRKQSKLQVAVGQIQAATRSIENLKDLYAIASRRSSKRKCLVCGSSDTAQLIFKDGFSEGFRHKCGGRLTCGRHPSGLRINFGRNVCCYVLDEQGDRIEMRVERQMAS